MNANTFIETYIAWLKQNTTALQIGNDVVEINSPFLDRHNDYIQIYISLSDGGYILTDDGYTISDLEMSGLAFNTTKRKEELNTILNGFGVSLNNATGELYCKCSQSNFPYKNTVLFRQY